MNERMTGTVEQALSVCRRLIFLRKTIAYVVCVITLQKPSYVVAVVEFCVYLIHLALSYCKSPQCSFVRFFGIVF